ncbi:MAG: HPr(Ser) kinase/phosphatase, partial [Myxococcales bacterium]|nr:HPr(Ser) kinase/phosphatase [Myxococcales bacterium]
MPTEVSVREFLEHAEGPLGLEVCAGRRGLSNILRSGRIQKPGLALAGYTRFVHRDRVQILGETEMSYLGTMDRDARERAVRGLVERKVACIIVTKGIELFPELVSICEELGTPLFRTSLRSSQVIRRTLAYLDDLLAPRCSVHGVLVDVNGVGVLLTGASGIGKSECALDLVERGHRLVADDVVEIRRRGEDLVGQASSMIQHLIEVRGLGILNIAELYGVAATRLHKRIELHVMLEVWSPETAYDRTGLDQRTFDILGVAIRSLRVPVSPGRNVAGIVEVAARNLLLQL